MSPTTLCPHGNGLYPGTLSHDYRWLLSIPYTYDHLYLSDLATGHRIRTYTSPSNVYSCAIATSLLFIACGGDRDIFLWHTASTRLVATLIGHTGWVRACRIFLHDTRIVSASVDRTLRIWQINPPACLHILSGHMARVDSCDVSADDAFIISMSDDKKLRVWSSDTGECLLVLTGHTNPPFVDSCTFSKSNQSNEKKKLFRCVNLVESYFQNLKIFFLKDVTRVFP